MAEKIKFTQGTPFRLLTGVVSLALASVFVLLQVVPNLPTVMGDELIYSTQARLSDLDEVRFGNFLHAWVYSLVDYLPIDSYLAVKVINAIFLFTYGAAIWKFATFALRPWIALAVALATVLGPVGLYTSFFMPEMMFFAFFTWSITFLVWGKLSEEKNYLFLLAASALSMSLASIVKPHALFALPLFGAILFGSKLRNWSRGLLEAVGYVALTIILKLAFGFLLAGTAGLTLLANYQGGFNSIISDLFGFLGGAEESPGTVAPAEASGIANETIETIPFLLTQAGQFLLAVLAIAGVPMIISLANLRRDRSILIWLGPALIGYYIVLISAFALYVSQSGDDHSDRILLRYFEFLFPLVIIAALYALVRDDRGNVYRYPFVMVATAGSLIALGLGFSWVDILMADSSYLVGIFKSADASWLIGLGSVALATIWLAQYKYRVAIASVAILLTSAGAGISAHSYQNQINSTMVASDYAGDYVRENYPDVPGSRFLVLGANKQLTQAGIFRMEKRDVEYRLFRPGSVLPESEIGEDLIVVTIGDIFLDSEASYEDARGFRIYNDPAD